MNFASDNAYGVLPEVLSALAQAAQGAALPYGDDDVTRALALRFNAVFEREIAMFPVMTGTAANALALATLVPPHGAILCHQDSHIVVHECGAPEFFTHGARLHTIAGADGKLEPGALEAVLKQWPWGDVHGVQPFAVSLSQPTELGTIYSREDISAIAALAHRHGLKLHVDGARFGNAVAALGRTPAEASWKCGVDVLSFGASKGGALAAEAVLFFDPADARDFAFRRKKAGHLASKMRLVSAQLAAFMDKDLWLHKAARANALAARLGEGLKARGVTITAPVQTNMVFAELPREIAARLRAGGAQFFDRTRASREDHVVARLVTSFATPEEDVERFLSLIV